MIDAFRLIKLTIMLIKEKLLYLKGNINNRKLSSAMINILRLIRHIMMLTT